IYRSPAGLLKTVVSVWPPGSKVYLGESVLLKCAVESNSTAQWGFEHVVSNDSYFITAVTREDAGSYRCKAGQTSSQPVELIVSGEQLQHLLCCVLFVSPNLLAQTVLVMFVLFAIIDWVSHISE
uniref:Ig-like domain-containing protein n=1 Tax=Haplochromis burtoni TaxID=8153 RepID=A0A3Q2VS51_HAPBU